MGSTNTCNEITNQISKIKLTGNVIPPLWYKNLTYTNSRGEYPFLLAINLLSDIVYWYTNTEVRNEQTGHVMSQKKKFKSDKLQRSYGQIEKFFGCSKKQAKEACDYLSNRGFISIEFRTIFSGNTAQSNVMFIEPIPTPIAEISNTLLPKSEGGYYRNGKEGVTEMGRRVLPISGGRIQRLHTETTTETTNNIAGKPANKKIQPKNPKEEKRKKVAPKKEKGKGGNPMVLIFDKHFQAKEGHGFTWKNGKHFKSLKSIFESLEDRFEKAEKRKPDKEEVHQVFDLVLGEILKDESLKWYEDNHFTPSGIYSQLENILNIIKNGRKGKKNGISKEAREWASRAFE